MSGATDGPTRLTDLVRDAVATLTTAGLPPDASRIDATVLARWCLGWDAATWLTHSIDPPPDGFRARFAVALGRRARREPVSHITGVREFYGRVFRVTPDVLTPRPETEHVVDEALAIMRARGRQAMAADVGTGSGCLAVTLALEMADGPLTVLATDISAAALDVARDNAARLGVHASIRFAHEDLLGSAAGAFDVIVANPPYIATTTAGQLAPEVLCEPQAALFGGPDGLDVIRRLIPAVGKALVPGGHLVMEIGHDQEDATVALVRAQRPLELIRVARDLQQLPRVVVARRVERL